MFCCGVDDDEDMYDVGNGSKRKNQQPAEEDEVYAAAKVCVCCRIVDLMVSQSMCFNSCVCVRVSVCACMCCVCVRVLFECVCV